MRILYRSPEHSCAGLPIVKIHPGLGRCPSPSASPATSEATQLIVMTPTGSETGARNSRSEMRLLLWADQQGGWKVFGSSSGSVCPTTPCSAQTPPWCGSIVGRPLPPSSAVALPRRFNGPAQQNGCLPGQRCPARLVAHPPPTGRGDLARQRRSSAIRTDRGS